MDGSSILQQIRCRYCDWLIASQCEDLLQHKCFEGYNEAVDVLHIDENSIATIEQKSHNRLLELETALLDFLKTPTPEVDAVNGFLKMLGEALRKLSYRKRAKLEIKIFEMVLQAESEEIE